MINASLGSTQQRIDELHFYLYDRAIHPELFRIYVTHRIRQQRYTAEIWITGLAHVVTMQAKDEILTELTSVSSDLLPKSGLVTTFRFRGERDHDELPGNVIRHIMSSQVERMSPNLFEATYRDLLRHARRRGLLREFEQWEYNGLVPFTFIDPEPRERELHLHAFFTFPEDSTLLKVQSIFEVEGPNPLKMY